MTALTFSSSASRRNSVTTLSAGPASSVKTGTTLTPPIPPSRLIFSIHNSAALRDGIPKGPDAGPDRNATTPILSSGGAPATGAARATPLAKHKPSIALSMMMTLGYWIMAVLLLKMYLRPFDEWPRRIYWLAPPASSHLRACCDAPYHRRDASRRQPDRTHQLARHFSWRPDVAARS